MDKYIAVILALVAVGAALLYGGRPSLVGLNIRPISLSLENLSFKLPDAQSAAISGLAWDTFSKYREYLKDKNLEGVRELSHQISEACRDEARREECNALMESTYALTANWVQGDFPNSAYDARQIALWTEVFSTESGALTQAYLLFTRDESGAPKVLGAKFCFGGEDVRGECVDTNPATRDTDGDGWWDAVEERFYK